MPVPATRVPSRNCTWPVAGVEPVVKTVAVAVVVSLVRMLSGLSDSATSARWEAPLIATVYFDDVVGARVVDGVDDRVGEVLVADGVVDLHLVAEGRALGHRVGVVSTDHEAVGDDVAGIAG